MSEIIFLPMDRPNMSGCHESLVVRVCSKYRNFYIFGLYRNPNNDDSIYNCLTSAMCRIQDSDCKTCFIFTGDFNAHHRNWLGSRSQTNSHGFSALDFANSAGFEQLVSQPTHTGGNVLDLVLTDVPGLVCVDVFAAIGSSDYSSLSLSIQMLQLPPKFSIERDVFLKDKVKWEAVNNDVSNICWSNIYKHPEPIQSLNDDLLKILKRHVPTKIIKFRSTDKCWFTEGCRLAYDRKQEGYRIWTRTRSDDNYQEHKIARREAAKFFMMQNLHII